MYYHTKSHACWSRSACGVLSFFIILCFFFAAGCAEEETVPKDNAAGKLRDAEPQVLVPKASGTVIYQETDIAVDASNTSQGYVMLKYTGTNEKVKFQIKTPDGTSYTYLVPKTGAYTVYPLSCGNGTYQLTLLEAASVEDDLYAVVFAQDLEVKLADEFLPFLYPNHYVDFSQDSIAVKKGKELAKDCTSDLEVVSYIYEYVTGSITYDDGKARNVAYGYTPDVDDTMKSGTGICFDYAALMSAMLRSQRIPTKLEVGYAGEVYHAWISCYVDEIGWVDNVIEFDGENWSLMDPTLAANNDSTSVREYIGDGSSYIVKYTY